jgi:hypothetical protein
VKTKPTLTVATAAREANVVEASGKERGKRRRVERDVAVLTIVGAVTVSG